MLRIKRDDVDDRVAVLLLQGRITGAWGFFLESECRDLERSGFRVVLDLSDVVFIGRSGLEALVRLERAGVLIVGCSPLVDAMLEQERIAARGSVEAAQDDAAKGAQR
jgi:anti-anti-sigma regulatory factor